MIEKNDIAANFEGYVVLSYKEFPERLKQRLKEEDIEINGDNTLFGSATCRDDNQRGRVAYVASSLGIKDKPFSLEKYGGYPSGIGVMTFKPGAGHVPDKDEVKHYIIVNTTHVGAYEHNGEIEWGEVRRYNMNKIGHCCGLNDGILVLHKEGKSAEEILDDAEMNNAYRAVSAYLDEIASSRVPIITIAKKLFEVGAKVYEDVLRKASEMYGVDIVYVGGVNIDVDPENEENNFIAVRKFCIFRNGEQKELRL